MHRQSLPLFALAGVLPLLVSCGSDDAPIDVVEPVAQFWGCAPDTRQERQLPVTELATIEARGGFVSRLSVDPTVTRNDALRFRRITDALLEAKRIRTAVPDGACRIQIDIAPGTYVGSTAGTDTLKERLPLWIDVRDVTLAGAHRPVYDDNMIPLAAAGTAPSTVLVADPALRIIGENSQTGYPEPMVIVNSEGGRGGDGARVGGIVFRSGHAASDTTVGGRGVFVMRSTDVLISGNRFEGNFAERVDLRGGSATVSANYSTGVGATCDICVAGPGKFSVIGNRLEQGGIPGILVVPVLNLSIPPGVTADTLLGESVVEVTIENNHVSGHQRVPVGTGIRVATVGNGSPNTHGKSRVLLRRNTVTGNRFGMIVEAGFPVAGSLLRGDVDITSIGNTIRNSCQGDFYVAFTRHSGGLGVSNNPYLRNSVYRLTLDESIAWRDAWFAHAEGMGNTLQVNDEIIAPGRNVPYNPSVVCP